MGLCGRQVESPAAELNKENVSEKLQAKGTDVSIVQQLVETMNDCEFARYAPGDRRKRWTRYAAATEVINKMESSIKRK